MASKRLRSEPGSPVTPARTFVRRRIDERAPAAGESSNGSSSKITGSTRLRQGRRDHDPDGARTALKKPTSKAVGKQRAGKTHHSIFPPRPLTCSHPERLPRVFDLTDKYFPEDPSNMYYISPDFDPEDDIKPMFTLDDFVIFDPANDFEMIGIEELDEAGYGMKGNLRNFEAAGLVKAVVVDGGEDDEDDEDDDDLNEISNLVHISSILKYQIDVGTDDP